MTGTCTLCGVLITVEPDGILDAARDDRTFGRLGGTYKKHLEKFHSGELQRVIGEAELAMLNISQLFAVGSVIYQSALLNSLMQSDDPVFVGKCGKLREIITQSIQPKTIDVPLLSAPQLVNPL